MRALLASHWSSTWSSESWRRFSCSRRRFSWHGSRPATAEQLIQDVFAAVDGQSILLITHRREGLDLVDRVIELENGRARENG